MNRTDYIKILKEVRKIMEKTSAKRYWGTIIMLIIGIAIVVAVWKSPEIITAINGK